MEQDSYFQKDRIRDEFKNAFPDLTDEDFGRAWSSFEGDGSLVGFDVESDGLDGALFEHEEHGTLNMNDMFILGTDEIYFGIGSAFPVRLYEMKSAVTEVAIDAGFSDAARMLSLLPIDSSSWTGISASFKFDDVAKSKVITLIDKARMELAKSPLTNAQHSKADAYLECALLMTEQDDPDADIIVVLIRRALALVTAIGLVADLKSIFGTS
jgi:hypothetical protein